MGRSLLAVMQDPPWTKTPKKKNQIVTIHTQAVSRVAPLWVVYVGWKRGVFDTGQRWLAWEEDLTSTDAIQIKMDDRTRNYRINSLRALLTPTFSCSK